MNMQKAMFYPKHEAYVDSTVDWLGKIPCDWQLRRFKFLVSISTGGKNTEDKKQDGQYPFYVRSQTPEKIDTYSFDGEAILTAGDGAGVGRVYHYVNGKFDIHQRVYKFSGFNEVIGSYLYRYLYVNFYNVAVLGTAKSTVDSLRLPLIQDFEICFPSEMEEQRKIVNFLDKKTAQIDEAIAIKEKQIALLKERQQIIIQQAVTRGLDPDVPMKDSGVDWIGEIPAHWEPMKLKHIFSETTERTETGMEKLLSLRMELGLVPHDDVSDKPIPDSDLIGYKKVSPGQMVMNRMRAAIGIFGVPRQSGLVSPDYAVFDLLQDLSLDYFLLLFKTHSLGTQFRLSSKGLGTGSSGFMRLYSDNFGNIYIPLCSREEQESTLRQINIEAKKTNSSVSLISRQIQKLIEYKTTLINSAVTGKIKVT